MIMKDAERMSIAAFRRAVDELERASYRAELTMKERAELIVEAREIWLALADYLGD